MKLTLSPVFARAWQGADPFAKVSELEGEVFRQVKSRRTFRFDFEGKSYFAKIHLGVGWAEIIKNLVTLKKPIVSAANEWHGINKLTQVGIDTMTSAAFGQRGLNPATIQSFIITEDLVNTVSLEAYCKNWTSTPPKFRFKTKLIRKLATVSRKLHQAGVCHRDYYLCHFHLETTNIELVKVSLIDLHRALIKTKLANRWVVKDISGLYFSAMDIGLTQRDLFRFMKVYSGMPLRECLNTQQSFWLNVEGKATKLYRKHEN
jgi:heptose I phosphotransferase